MSTDVEQDATPCRVAFVGAGSMAREHLRAFADVPGVGLAGIHSRTRQRAESLASEFCIAHVCESVDELYERTSANLVVVCVPELATNTVACRCFAFPWAALIEKPAGYDVADAEEIAVRARQLKARAYVALNRRLYSSTQAVLDDLNLRDDPRYIRVQDQQDQAAALAAGQPPAVVKNWMYANSIHTIDYFRVFGRGRVTDVSPIVRWTADRPGIVLAKLVFESGDIGVYEGIWNGPGPWAVTVSTPRRRWEVRPLEHAAFQNNGERVLNAVDVHQWDKQFKAGFRRQAQLAVSAAQGGESCQLATLEEGLETMRLVQRIFT